MRAGKLRHLILLEENVASGTDAYGAPVTTWTPRGPATGVWAEVAPVSLTKMSGAKEMVAGGAETALDLVTVTLYPFPGIAPLTWRFTYKGRLYDIKAAREANDDSTLTFIAAVGAV